MKGTHSTSQDFLLTAFMLNAGLILECLHQVLIFPGPFFKSLEFVGYGHLKSIFPVLTVLLVILEMY